MQNDIDLKKLNKALAQFGSLEKTVETLQAKKLGLENDIAQLSTSKTKLEQEVAFPGREENVQFGCSGESQCRVQGEVVAMGAVQWVYVPGQRPGA